jgi:succinate dehydrogenase hydrophobic anchor subunit
VKPNPYAQEPRATSAWLWQIGTGVALVPLLGLHIVANHFVVEGGLRDYADVVSYLRNPIILVLESMFLLTVTAHALLGIRAMTLDLGLSDHAARRLTRALTVVGVLMVGYGMSLTWIVIR